MPGLELAMQLPSLVAPAQTCDLSQPYSRTIAPVRESAFCISSIHKGPRTKIQVDDRWHSFKKIGDIIVTLGKQTAGTAAAG